MRPALLVVPLLLAACGSSTRTPPRVPPPPSAPAEPPSRVDLGDPFDLPRLAGTLPDGRRAVLMSGMRFALGGEAAIAAPVIVHAPFAGAVQTADGWRFLDASGALWQSRDFLGSLERAGSIGAEPFRTTSSRGALVVLGGEGRDALRIGDGTAALRPLLEGQQVRSASFLDPQHGAVLLEGGLLALTADGGTTWRRIGLDVLPANLEAWDDGWHVGVFLDASRPPGSAPPAHTYLELTTDGQTRQRESSAWDVPAWAGDLIGLITALASASPALLSGSASTPFVQGRFVLGGPDSREVLRLDPAGRLIDRAPALPSESCSTRRWGGRVLAICRNAGQGAAATELLASDDGRAFTRLLTMADDGWGVVPSVDGQSIAWVGQRDSGPPELHVWREAGETTLPMQQGTSPSILAAHGARVVGRSGYGREQTLWVADCDRRSVETIPIPEPVDEPLLAFDGDGTLLLCGTKDNGRLLCWRALRGEALAPLRLPEGMRAVSFADARRGMAVGDDLAQLHRTTDGGDSWQRLDLGIADAGRLALAHRDSAPALRCFAERCAVGGSLFAGRVALAIWGWGELQRPTTTIVPTDEIASPPRGPSDSRTLLPLSCALGDAPAPRLRTPAALRPTERALEVSGGGAFARLVLDTAAGSARLDWWGADERGAYLGSSRATPLAALGGANDSINVRGVLLDRRAALLDVCVEECASWLATPRRPLVLVTGVTTPRREPALAVVTADGSLARAAQPYTSSTVHRLSSAGALQTTRRFSFEQIGPRGLTDAGQLVYLDRRRRWHVLPVTDDGALPSSPAAAAPELAACAGPRPADATTVLVDVPDGFRAVGLPALPAMRGVLELRGDSTCVRAVELWPGAYDDPDVSGRVEPGPDGRFAGWLSARGRIHSLRCALERQ